MKCSPRAPGSSQNIMEVWEGSEVVISVKNDYCSIVFFFRRGNVSVQKNFKTPLEYPKRRFRNLFGILSVVGNSLHQSSDTDLSESRLTWII